MSSLIYASKNGHVEVVNMLLQHGARVDLQKEVYTCMYNLYSSTINFFGKVQVQSMSTLVSKKCKHPIPSGTHQNKVPRKGPDLTLPSRDKHTTLQAEAHSVSSVKDQVRKSINRRVKEQPPGMLKSLRESQHFVIDVKETHTHGQLVAAVRCGACKKSIRLQAKEVVTTGTTSYLISNWTRHARSCHKLLFKSDQQKSLGMYLNTLSQSKSIDGSALVFVVNCDGYENTETHIAGPTERTSVNGSRNIPEHVYEEQSLLMHESQYNKKTHEDVPGIAEEKGRLPNNSPVIQPFINQSECAQVISCALMLNQRLQDIGDVPSCGKGHQLVSQHSLYTPKENCKNEIEK